MRLAMAALCDAANVREGTLGVLGAGLNVLWHDEYPAPMRMWLAVLVEVSSSDSGRSVAVEITVQAAKDQDQPAPLALIEGEFVVESADGTSTYLPMPIDFTGVELPEAGEYHVALRLDGVERARIPFYARSGAQNPSAAT